MMRFAQSFFRPDDVLQVNAPAAMSRPSAKVRLTNEGPYQVPSSTFAAMTAALALTVAGAPTIIDTFQPQPLRSATPSSLTLEVLAPSPLRAWAASRWGERKGPRPSKTEMKDLLASIRKNLANAG
jgi:hypothetical protein